MDIRVVSTIGMGKDHIVIEEDTPVSKVQIDIWKEEWDELKECAEQIGWDDEDQLIVYDVHETVNDTIEISTNRGLVEITKKLYEKIKDCAKRVGYEYMV